MRRATILLVTTLAACHADDKAELAKLNSQIAAQQKRIDDQERQIVALQRELAAARTKHAAVPEPSPGATKDSADEVPATEWKLAITQLSHNSHSHALHARFQVTNVTSQRRKGSLCAQLLDGGGAEIEHFVTPERAVPAGGTEIVEVDAPLPTNQWSQVAHLRSYVAPYGCSDEAPAAPLLVDRQGRPAPPPRP